MIRLAAVRMLVGAEPERLHGGHPELAGAADVLVEAVADEQRALRLDFKGVERAPEDLRMRLPLPDLGREDGEVEPLCEAHLLQVALEEPAWVEGVRDERELEPAV